MSELYVEWSSLVWLPSAGVKETNLCTSKQFRSFSLDCILHTVIPHVITVLEWWGFSRDVRHWNSHVTPPFQY